MNAQNQTRRLAVAVSAVVLGLVAYMQVTSSQAAIIASDSFATAEGGSDYNVSGIYNQNPTVGLSGFTGAWGSGNTAALQAANGGLTHPRVTGTPLDGQLIAFTSDGTATRILSREIVYTPTDGTYYMSVLMQKNAVTNTRDLLAGLGTTEVVGTDFTTTGGTYIGIYNGGIGFYGGGSATTLLSDALMNVGETYMGILEFNYSTTGTDTVTATVLNNLGVTVANQVFTGLNLDANFDRFNVTTIDYSANVVLDEWRFGTTLEDVFYVQPVPEPSTALLLCLGLVGLTVRHRKMK